MLNKRIFRICFLVSAFSLILLSNSIAYAEQCIVPTLPKDVIFPSYWYGAPKIYMNRDVVDPGSFVDAWVVSTWPCPPYSWSISGNNFSLQKGSTGGDYEINKVNAGSSSCGTAEITVANAIGNTAKGYLRSTSGDWTEDQIVAIRGKWEVCPEYPGCKAYGQDPYRVCVGVSSAHIWSVKESTSPSGACGCPGEDPARSGVCSMTVTDGICTYTATRNPGDHGIFGLTLIRRDWVCLP